MGSFLHAGRLVQVALAVLTITTLLGCAPSTEQQEVSPCEAVPDGTYCGSQLGGQPDSLYECIGQMAVSTTPCPDGCSGRRCESSQADAGQGDAGQGADAGGNDQDPCTSASAGDGAYCGGNLAGGEADVLYQCQGGNTVSEEVCTEGCQLNPPGTPDRCASSDSQCCLDVPPGTVTQSYSACGMGGSHYGIDYGVAVGTQIRAGISGTVVSMTLGYPNCYNNGCTPQCWNSFNYVKIRSDCGDPTAPSNDLYIYYLHIDSVPPGIAPGVHVGRSDLVAYSGNSGCSTGPHIHIETVSVPSGSGAGLSTCSSKNPGLLYCD